MLADVLILIPLDSNDSAQVGETSITTNVNRPP